MILRAAVAEAVLHPHKRRDSPGSTELNHFFDVVELLLNLLTGLIGSPVSSWSDVILYANDVGFCETAGLRGIPIHVMIAVANN